MTDKEKAQEEIWREHFAKKFYLSTPEEKITSMSLLKDFKQSLKKEVELRVKEVDRKNRIHNSDGDHQGYTDKIIFYRHEELSLILRLLDTVKPIL